MKIKIIQSCLSETKVEQKVNVFIQNTNIKVLEIQYKPTIWVCSVMIVYEDKNETNQPNVHFTH